MKTLKVSCLLIFYAFLCIRGHPLYGDDDKDGCGPSKSYELKDDKSEPIKGTSTNSSSSNSSSKNR